MRGAVLALWGANTAVSGTPQREYGLPIQGLQWLHWRVATMNVSVSVSDGLGANGTATLALSKGDWFSGDYTRRITSEADLPCNPGGWTLFEDNMVITYDPFYAGEEVDGEFSMTLMDKTFVEAGSNWTFNFNFHVRLGGQEYQSGALTDPTIDPLAIGIWEVGGVGDDPLYPAEAWRVRGTMFSLGDPVGSCVVNVNPAPPFYAWRDPGGNPLYDPFTGAPV